MSQIPISILDEPTDTTYQIESEVIGDKLLRVRIVATKPAIIRRFPRFHIGRTEPFEENREQTFQFKSGDFFRLGEKVWCRVANGSSHSLRVVVRQNIQKRLRFKDTL